MFVIRKFVVGAGTAALLAAGALVLLAQPGVAATRSFGDNSTVTVAAPSAACTASIQAIKDAVVADQSEDAVERAVAKTEGAAAADATEDAAERSRFIALFRAARTACLPAATTTTTVTTPSVRTFTPSAACTSAIHAVKDFLANGRPATLAQWRQLESLLQAARTACGLPATWTLGR
jgi:hypothetical protein